PDSVSLVSLRRLCHALSCLVRVVRHNRDKSATLILSSASAASILAAALVQTWSRHAITRSVILLHGELHGIRDAWRSRNPLYRALDLRSALHRWYGPRLR